MVVRLGENGVEKTSLHPEVPVACSSSTSVQSDMCMANSTVSKAAFKEQGETFYDRAEKASDVPIMTFNYASISDLSACANDTTVDIMGVCKLVGDLSIVVLSDKKELTRRDITLVDRSSTEVSLTLWGLTAETFDGVGNPIVAANGCCVSNFNGVTVSGGDIVINPDLDLAHELREWWDTEGSDMATVSITVQVTSSKKRKRSVNSYNYYVNKMNKFKQDQKECDPEVVLDMISVRATWKEFSKEKKAEIKREAENYYDLNVSSTAKDSESSSEKKNEKKKDRDRSYRRRMSDISKHEKEEKQTFIEDFEEVLNEKEQTLKKLKQLKENLEKEISDIETESNSIEKTMLDKYLKEESLKVKVKEAYSHHKQCKK
eukprot:GFUD01044742.1.p1 GENE.GFUD01044742.1~~GFUD01044742.1.p1  ORF type:complete len:375 (-),score=94.87 GFUD01044742.1:643-1767(-)